MIDVDTFLTELYVMVDDFCKAEVFPVKRPGPSASLSTSEVVTLAAFAQWDHFRNESDFYRYACRRLRSTFPNLPDRSQFNRLVRHHHEVIVAFFLYLADLLGAGRDPFEALDGSGVPTRNLKRRGSGWLPEQANIGWSNRVGWYEGFYLLAAANPVGVITGFGFAPASSKDQVVAEAFFALRRYPDPRLSSVGKPADGPYAVDKGFEGPKHHRHWLQDYGAAVLCPPKRDMKRQWPTELRRWVAGLRQIVETAFDKLLYTFRLLRERPHELGGFRARLASKVVLHNFCIWLNQRLGRERLAFADLIDW